MYGIAELELGKGRLGIAPMPGRGGAYDADLAAILRWKANLVLTMTTADELARSGAADLGRDLALADVVWRHLPVPDFGRPPPETERLWAAASAEAHRVLGGGGRVLSHCFGGCGRSGMTLLRLMVEAGEDPAIALGRLRAVRPCAVETDAQFLWASDG